MLQHWMTLFCEVSEQGAPSHPPRLHEAQACLGLLSLDLLHFPHHSLEKKIFFNKSMVYSSPLWNKSIDIKDPFLRQAPFTVSGAQIFQGHHSTCFLYKVTLFFQELTEAPYTLDHHQPCGWGSGENEDSKNRMDWGQGLGYLQSYLLDFHFSSGTGLALPLGFVFMQSDYQFCVACKLFTIWKSLPSLRM